MWPFVTFAEFPDCHHEAGKVLKGIIDAWLNAVGEAPDSADYPKLNAELAECGGVRAYFKWKDGKNRTYVNVFIA